MRRESSWMHQARPTGPGPLTGRPSNFSATTVARVLRCAAVLSALSLGGCSLWRGELDPDLRKRLDGRLRNIELSRLEQKSIAPPKTIDESLAELKGSGAPQPIKDAAESLSLGVDDVRRQALENNLDLRINAIEPEIARTKISAEEAKFDATIMVGAAYDKSDLPELDGDLVRLSEKSTAYEKVFKEIQSSLPGASPDGKSSLSDRIVKLNQVEQQKEKVDADLGIVVPLPTGAKIGVGQEYDQKNILSPFVSSQSLVATRFSISQPLLRNAGTEVNLASIRIARLGNRAAIARTKLAAIRILATAEKAYWKLYGARRLLEIRQKLNELADRNLEIVRQRAAQGLTAQIEIIRAEVGVALQRELLIIAQTNERIIQRELKRILNISGVDLTSDVRLELSTQPRLLQYRLDPFSLVKEALAGRMEMLELELAIAADTLRVGIAKNQTLPLITLDFEYGIVDRGGSPGTAWQSAWSFDKGELGVGIRGEIPVTNQLREAQLREAVLTRSQRLATRAARELAIRQEVLDAHDVLNQEWQRILAARQSVIASGQNYDAELKQFDQGSRTMREVFEGLSQLGDAQFREVQAIVAYQAALIDLAFATGTLLGHAKVDFLDLPAGPVVDPER